MKNLEQILEFVNDSTTILIVSKNNSKILSNHLTNYVYKNSKLQKYDIDKCKALLKRLEKYKNRIIKFNFDITKLQISSSNARIESDFHNLIELAFNNNLKLLFEYDLPITYGINRIPFMYFFDLIILVNNNEAKIIQNRKYYNTEKEVFNLDIFLRKIKLVLRSRKDPSRNSSKH